MIKKPNATNKSEAGSGTMVICRNPPARDPPVGATKSLINIFHVPFGFVPLRPERTAP